MIIYFTITNGKGGTHRCANTSCLCEDCYLCPFERCTRYASSFEIRAHGDAAAIAWAMARRPKTFKIIRIINEKGATNGNSKS